VPLDSESIRGFLSEIDEVLAQQPLLMKSDDQTNAYALSSEKVTDLRAAPM
jgi:hypothetical protein